ncbi:hypothetical protein Tco_1501173 [Tanacetum coccineum]
MGDEHLSTIPETESDKVTKSSVEDLVPIPSESEGISNDTCDAPFCDNTPPFDILNDHFEIFSDFNNDCTSSDDDSFEALPPDSELVSLEEEKDDILHEKLLNINLLIACDSPSSDDFSPISIFEEKSVTFSNPLFDSNDDFTSSDDESLSDEDVPEDNGFTDEPPLEENDDLFDLESKGNEWKKILYDALIDDVIFDPRGDVDEIDAFLDINISTDIEEGYHDSKGDIIYLEHLLSDDTTLSLPPKVFLDHDPRSLGDINDLKIMVKVFDPGIHEIIFSPTYGSLPFKDHHYFSFTYVIRTFLPYFTYPVNSPFPLSSGSEDIIFDPGISAFHFSSLKPVAYECPVEVCSSTCFVPIITMI